MNQNRRRRRIESSEESEQEYNVEVEHPKKKPRRSNYKELLATIEDQMFKLCDLNIITVQKRIEDLVRLIGVEVEGCKKEIMKLLLFCIEKRPMQSATYATFVGLLNVQHYNFGAECLDILQKQFIDSLKAGEWNRARSILLLQADLVNTNVLTSSSMLLQLTTLTDMSEEEDSPQRQTDFYIYLVLMTLPLVGRELYEKKETALNALFKRLLLYVKKQRDATANGVQVLHIWSKGEMMQQEYLELLWHQIMRLESENWMEKQLQRPYAKFDDKLSSALQHRLPALTLPHRERDASFPYPRPWLNFRLFQQCDIPPNLHLPDDLDIGRHVITLHILEILQLWHLERKICADQLLAYAASCPTIAMQHLLIEVLLGQMLQLPSAPYLIINYGSIIVELCKLQPQTLPRIVAHATCLLFKQVEFMSVSSFDRFVDWFSHHLSNFRFQWLWQDWAYAITLPELHPSSMFIRELLKKCMRWVIRTALTFAISIIDHHLSHSLSYHQKIVDMVPSCFEALLPAAPVHDYKYLNVLLPGAELAKDLLDAVRNRTDPMLIGGIVEANDLEGSLKVNVLMQTFLHLGCKTFTHINSLFTKYHAVLKMLSCSEANQLYMLQALFELWASNEQLKVVLADKLMKIDVINTHVIVTWIFDPKLKQDLVKPYLWELLNMTIRYTKTHLRVSAEEQESLMQCLILHIVQCCVKVLLEHQKIMEDTEEKTVYWFNWVLGRLKALLFNHMDDVRKFGNKLHEVTFELDQCKPLLKMFEDYLAYIG